MCPCMTTVPAACSMNPLGLKAERFVVAVDEAGSDATMLGFGQLEPHGDAQKPTFLELRTLIVDPTHRQSPCACLTDSLTQQRSDSGLRLEFLDDQ